ncbi:hypothetical protein GU243_23480 (plasmid) [Pseudarthrobacter psychrotolerans]|uniref:Uncharacterized protein n=1 Tax=Pseudarthrobacter psychrotolerans TaxID=2697569 RepID=A0A6P1NTW4_9MICC|nr:hypothetical protein [Pseudarthrobacter psychrotolerans]QHK22533.1 hypothetical protein GU243_23480 [Pseudarthrobacter psychrotolerans]
MSVEGLSDYDAVFAEAVFTFVQVCRQRGCAPEPVLLADLGSIPSVYTGEVGLGWAFRLQETDALHAVTEDGALYRATRTWRLHRKPSWLQQVSGSYFLIATSEVQINKTSQLRADIMNGLLQFLEEEGR